MEIIKKLTKKNCYLGKNKAKYIVIHETDNTDKGADAERHAQAARNGNINPVHFYVDEHSIYQSLRLTDGAWAVGTRYGTPLVSGVTNYNSINIEICVNKGGDYEKARENTIWLVKYLMKETGIKADKVIRHYDAKKKWCPRKMMDNPELWEDFKKQIRKTTEVSKKFKVGDYNDYVIITKDCPIRKGRGKKYKKIGSYKKGKKVKILYIGKNSAGNLWGSVDYGSSVGYIYIGNCKPV